MEHILQFGVSIDDDAIIKHAKEMATQQIVRTVKKEIDSYTNGWTETKLERLFREEIRKVLNAKQDVIIENAIEHLTKNMSKTKAVKEAIANE